MERREFFKSLFGFLGAVKLAPVVVAKEATGILGVNSKLEFMEKPFTPPDLSFWDAFTPGQTLRFEIPLPKDGSPFLPAFCKRTGAGAYKPVSGVQCISIEAPNAAREVIDVTAHEQDSGFRNFVPGPLEMERVNFEVRPEEGGFPVEVTVKPLYQDSDLIQERDGETVLIFEAVIERVEKRTIV